MGEENAYRLRHLHDHYARGVHGDIRDLFAGADIEYGDGTGYCRKCGMNEPRHISKCPEARKAER